MSDVQTVSMIGLGNMGSALARAIAKAGHDLTVWNRSGEKCRPLADEGASVALSVGEAVSRSDVIVVCVRAATTSPLRSSTTTPPLRGHWRGNTDPAGTRRSDRGCRFHRLVHRSGRNLSGWRDHGVPGRCWNSRVPDPHLRRTRQHSSDANPCLTHLAATSGFLVPIRPHPR